jgi:hypothetical protein
MNKYATKTLKCIKIELILNKNKSIELLSIKKRLSNFITETIAAFFSIFCKRLFMLIKSSKANNISFGKKTFFSEYLKLQKKFTLLNNLV